jgi:hypothetical protein
VNKNQHYISQCLIKRFAKPKPDGTIEKYNIKYGKWKTTGPKGVFSELGYNQLLAFGDFNNDLDERLKSLEDTLPESLKALDDAAEVVSGHSKPASKGRMKTSHFEGSIACWAAWAAHGRNERTQCELAAYDINFGGQRLVQPADCA